MITIIKSLFYLTIPFILFLISKNQIKVRKKRKFIRKGVSFLNKNFIDKEVIILNFKNTYELKFPNFEGLNDKKGIMHFFYEFIYPFLIQKRLIDYASPFYAGKFYFMSEGPYFYNKVQIDKGDIVIDAGAYMGIFSCFAASLGGIIYAFEPVSESREKYLSKITKIYPNIIIVPYALADKKAEAEIFIKGGGSTLFPEKAEKIDCRKEKVKTISLDEWVEENRIEKIDFIKADIEGAERLMLKGAFNVLKKFSPKLSICTYHFRVDRKILSKLILKANSNYNIRHKYHKLYAWIEK